MAWPLHGAANLAVQTTDRDPPGCVVQPYGPVCAIPQAIAKFSEQPDKYTIEKRMSFSSLPSIEHFIDNDGPSKMYDCSMRCVNNAWTGMITPANDLPESVSGPMNRWGTDLSALLYREGYRGTVDIDCGVTSDGTIYATESNCRKTGGSYLHSLLTRLKGADYARTTTWLADSRVGRSELSFEEGIGALERAGIPVLCLLILYPKAGSRSGREGHPRTTTVSG